MAPEEVSVLAWIATALAADATWQLDPARSQLYVVVRYDRERMTPVQAHDHVIAASTFTGTARWDPGDVTRCDVQISFPVSALVVDPPGAREREKLDPAGAIDDATKRTVVGNMTSKSNLFASSFPTISYRSTRCAASGSQVVVTGVLTIRGAGEELTVPMTVEVGETFRARGTFSLTHADFGMAPFTYGPFTPKNEEALRFVVDLVGRPSGG